MFVKSAVMKLLLDAGPVPLGGGGTGVGGGVGAGVGTGTGTGGLVRGSIVLTQSPFQDHHRFELFSW